jgi:hypothetical protein
MFMTDSIQPSLTPQAVEQLQCLRVSVLAFQNMIAALPAEAQDNARNEQFNQLRLEAKALLKEVNFDKKVDRASTEDLQVERQVRVILPRLSGIVIFGVILALLGLGVNSIILDEVFINSLACLVSSGGMLLIVMAFVVWAWTGRRQRLTNLGELYLSCNGLLYEINHALNKVIPGFDEHPAVNPAQTPSLAAMLLDSLTKQAADWQQRVRNLEEQRLALGVDAPLELRVNLDFARRELQRVQQEYDRLHGQPQANLPLAVTSAQPMVIIPPGAEEADWEVDASAMRRAKSVTMEMPTSRPEQLDS